MTNQAKAQAAMNRVIKIAIEMGYVTSADQFAALSEQSQLNIIKSAGRLLGRRHGQGWSR